MTKPNEVPLISRRSQRVTIVILGLTVILAVLEACSPTKGTGRQSPIQGTTPTVEEYSSFPIELTANANSKHPFPSHVARAMVTKGKLEYQIDGQSSVSAVANEEVPIGSDVQLKVSDEIAELRLEEGSILTLFPYTVIRLIRVEQSTGTPGTKIILGAGTILVASADLWVISSDLLFKLWVNQSTAAVSFEPLKNTITVNCFGKTGSCLFQGLSQVDELTPGQQLKYIGTIRGKVGNADLETWLALYRDLLQTPVPTPTPTFTPPPVNTPFQIPGTAQPTHSPSDENNEEPGNGSERRGGGKEGGGGEGDGGKGG